MQQDLARLAALVRPLCKETTYLYSEFENSENGFASEREITLGPTPKHLHAFWVFPITCVFRKYSVLCGLNSGNALS